MRICIFFNTIMLAALVGCSSSTVTQSDVSPTEVESSRQYVAAIEPSDSIGVGKARQSVQSGQQVTLVGLIGGSREPFVDGIAAFTIVDTSVPYCAPGEGCPSPWDYCCKKNQVKENIATVKLIDDAGGALSGDARRLLGVKELSTVVVQGEAIRDDQGNLTVAAKQVFVRPGNG